MRYQEKFTDIHLIYNRKTIRVVALNKKIQSQGLLRMIYNYEGILTSNSEDRKLLINYYLFGKKVFRSNKKRTIYYIYIYQQSYVRRFKQCFKKKIWICYFFDKMALVKKVTKKTIINCDFEFCCKKSSKQD